jgi:hypothetical protein
MYDKQPYIAVSSDESECSLGWKAIGERLQRSASGERCIVCVECYPGVLISDVVQHLTRALQPELVVSTESLFLSPQEIESRVAPILTDDPVFGVLNGIEIRDFFDERKLAHVQEAIHQITRGTILVIGTGASEVTPEHQLLVYADLARWEIQRRQRRGEICNLGVANHNDSPAQKYKRGFFLDWRAADRVKQRVLSTLHFLLDTNDVQAPKLISGDAMRTGLKLATTRPFRVVPFFDPGPWGGHWMEREFDLPKDVPNYAWCFDCVPEENSLLLGFGNLRVELPAINLVFAHPQELLGCDIYHRFGAEFPIRFD